MQPVFARSVSSISNPRSSAEKEERKKKRGGKSALRVLSYSVYRSVCHKSSVIGAFLCILSDKKRKKNSLNVSKRLILRMMGVPSAAARRIRLRSEENQLIANDILIRRKSSI